jgi:hypothetical protein
VPITSVVLLAAAWILTGVFFVLCRWHLEKKMKPFGKLVVALMVLTACCLGAALWKITGYVPPPAAPAVQDPTVKSADVRIEPQACKVSPFTPGDHELPENIDSTCLELVASRLANPALTLDELVLTGHVDNHELKPSAVRIYGSNLSLALQRALTVRGWLKRKQDAIGRQPGKPSKVDVESLAVLVASGAEHVGDSVSNSDRKADRYVEIRASWRLPSSPPEAGETLRWYERIGRQLNVPPGFDAATMLTLLAFVVALSAYLASVRVSLKALMSEVETTNGGNTTIRKVDPKSTKVALVLISVADLPMILAALFIGLYVFAFAPPFVLRWGLFLFAFAGGTMIILHASEWLESSIAVYKNKL